MKFTQKDVHNKELSVCWSGMLIYMYNQLSKTRRTPSGSALTVLLREVSSLVEARGSVTPVILKLNLSARNTGLFNLHKTAKTETLQQKSGIAFSLSNQTFITSKRWQLRGLKA